MVHAFALALLLSRETPQVPQLCPWYCANDSPPVSIEGNWCVFYRAWSLFLMSATCPSIVYSSFVSPSGDLFLTVDPIAISPSLTSPPLKQAPQVAPMLCIAKATMHRHMRILLFFPTCQLLAANVVLLSLVFRHIPMAP